MAMAMPEIDCEPSLPPPDEAPPAAANKPSTLERPSREEFLGVYEATGRNVRATSKHFGRDRRQIYRWLELYNIERR